MNESLVVIRGPIGVGKSTTAQVLRDLMPNQASLVESDGVKRMIDPHGSSEWRRTVAHNTAIFLADQLLQIPRTAIVEGHTRYPQVIKDLSRVATKNNAYFVTVLLTAPLAVCHSRVDERAIPGITYRIDHNMVNDYYCNMDPNPGDLVFDTTQSSPTEIAGEIFSTLAHNNRLPNS